MYVLYQCQCCSIYCHTALITAARPRSLMFASVVAAVVALQQGLGEAEGSKEPVQSSIQRHPSHSTLHSLSFALLPPRPPRPSRRARLARLLCLFLSRALSLSSFPRLSIAIVTSTAAAATLYRTFSSHPNQPCKPLLAPSSGRPDLLHPDAPLKLALFPLLLLELPTLYSSVGPNSTYLAVPWIVSDSSLPSQTAIPTMCVKMVTFFVRLSN